MGRIRVVAVDMARARRASRYSGIEVAPCSKTSFLEDFL